MTIGAAALCERVSDELLLRHRICIQPINYPTVSRGTERLRITASSLHDDEAMDGIVAALEDVWARLHPECPPAAIRAGSPARA